MTNGPILVTGSAGFVGSRLVAALRNARGVRVLTHARTAGPGVDVAADLADEAATAAMIARVQPSAVAHIAGHASAATARTNPRKTWRDNRDASYSLAKAIAGKAPNTAVLFAGTAEIYGESFRDGPADETTVPRPRGPYATSKLASEYVLDRTLPQSARLILCRPVNHTGTGQAENFVVPSFAAQIARIEAGLADPVMDVGNLDARRDFIDVDDVVDAYVSLLLNLDAMPARTALNIARGRCQPIRYVLDHLIGQASCAIEWRIARERLRPDDIAEVTVRAERIENLIGWSPRISLDHTLDTVLRDKRAQQRELSA
ncbi:NAD-dependent epimerase/dehydratase family protein [Acuticoccus sp. MNP-M23]|uniref:NAD-dependent epimerase/dehydratase family protein n=1 Tax=Acuticoccus sp. MNP-M23 TaxID=3072793 RepID=UPI0028155835|nr:NAD-dependent epimerase/dehydratase family protein [Acuticoccus sp. MNP-M23]WMS42164.1 NAD-dependent epimerase/dehydratase family protein [Acuticoccus sp. MNP-M23]